MDRGGSAGSTTPNTLEPLSYIICLDEKVSTKLVPYMTLPSTFPQVLSGSGQVLRVWAGSSGSRRPLTL